MPNTALLIHLLSRSRALAWCHRGDYPDVNDISLSTGFRTLKFGTLHLEPIDDNAVLLKATLPGKGPTILAIVGNTSSYQDKQMRSGFDPVERDCYKVLSIASEFELAMMKYSRDDLDYMRLFSIGLDLLGSPFFLTSKDFDVIALSSGAEKICPSRDENNRIIQDEIMSIVTGEDDFFGVAREKAPFFYQSRYLCRNIFRGGRYEARLVTLFDDEVTPGFIAAFELLASYTEHLYTRLSHGSFHQRQQDEMHELLRNLPKKEPTKADELTIVSQWGASCHYHAVVLELHNESNYQDHVDFAMMLLEDTASLSVAVSFMDKRIAWFVPFERTDGYAYLKDILKQCYESFGQSGVLVNTLVGVSSPKSSAQDLQSALLEAQSVYDLLQDSHGDLTLEICQFSDYVMDFVLSNTSGTLPSESVLHPAVRRLRDWDAKHKSDLLVTWKTYIECEFSQTDTALSLYIHRSTLLRRLSMIKKVGGVEDIGEDMLHILLSIELVLKR